MKKKICKFFTAKYLNSIGLLCDLIGVLITSWDLFFMTPERAKSVAGIYADGGERQINALLANSQDLKIGIVFILVGFFLQFVGVLKEK